MEGKRPALCGWCQHRRTERTEDGRITCDAYPFGVPDFILLGADHRKPQEGDNGIQFKDLENNPLPDYLREIYDQGD